MLQKARPCSELIGTERAPHNFPAAPTGPDPSRNSDTVESSDTCISGGNIDLERLKAFGKAIRQVWDDMLKKGPNPRDDDYLREALPISKFRHMLAKIINGADPPVVAAENDLSVDLIVRRAGLIRFEPKP